MFLWTTHASNSLCTRTPWDYLQCLERQNSFGIHLPSSDRLVCISGLAQHSGFCPACWPWKSAHEFRPGKPGTRFILRAMVHGQQRRTVIACCGLLLSSVAGASMTSLERITFEQWLYLLALQRYFSIKYTARSFYPSWQSVLTPTRRLNSY